MKVLVLGSGGREHALAWKIKESNKLSKLFIAPGNAGTATVGENVDISVTDFSPAKCKKQIFKKQQKRPNYGVNILYHLGSLK